MRRSLLVLAVALLSPSSALAQSAPPLPPPGATPPAPPPNGYAPPPQYYGPPPPGYPYAYPPQADERPEEVDAEEGRPPPTGYHLETRYRKGLLITGPIVFGVPYIVSLSTALGGTTTTGDGWLAVPVLGPFLDLATRPKPSCSAPDSDALACTNDSGNRVLLALDGLMQSAGAIVLIAGLSAPKQLWVRDFVGERDATHFSFSVAPVRLGHSGTGAAIVGEF